jgi:ATP-binding cassette, subfamily B, bacterial
LRNADRIVVIKGGVVAESGPHQELLDADGRYAELHRLQFGSRT